MDSISSFRVSAREEIVLGMKPKLEFNLVRQTDFAEIGSYL